jgi:hypothetical protein
VVGEHGEHRRADEVQRQVRRRLDVELPRLRQREAEEDGERPDDLNGLIHRGSMPNRR